MKKIFLQIMLLVFSFFAVWFALQQIDWIKIFHIEQAKKNMEEKLGDSYWEFFKKVSEEIKYKKVALPVDSIVKKICEENNINKEKIKIHILRKGEVNAFTLPNNHLVILSGLIETCDNEAELAGVIAHELAHMEKGHVMKKMVKEVGLSTLTSIAGGSSGAVIIKETAKLLSSSAYDRTLEREADITGVDYLIKANIDPEPFANFLYRLSDETKMPNQIYWLSTHPESKERAEDIINYIKDKKIIKKSILSSDTWIKLKEVLKEE
ncbi:MAG: M48 family metallopeptidase [Bacteroidota bacterium]